jgi:hypothetical protein
MRRTPGTALLVLSLAVVASCGSAELGGGAKAAWPTASAPIDVQGVSWVKGTTFGDSTGPLFDVKPAPASFVVAGDGIYYGTGDESVQNQPGQRVYYGAGQRMYYATAGGTTDLGKVGNPDTLKASPDGRWIAFIDFGSGPAEAVVVDTTTGKEVLRTDKHMADENGGDASDLYAEEPPGIPLITDDVVWIEAPHGYLEYKLASGDLVDHGADPFRERGDQILSPWWANRTEDGQGIWNQSREWNISDASNRGAQFVRKDGVQVRPQPRGQYYLLGWIDDTTAYGVRAGQLVTCRAPKFACADVLGAAGDGVLLPNGANASGDMFLAP